MNTPKVRFEKVSMRFGPARASMTVVDDVSFDLQANEFLSLVGPSGCGKTTMLNMLAGFLEPSSGRVLLDGAPVAGPGSDRGVIFQEYGVFPWLTVEKNIEFGLTLARNRRPPSERRDVVERYLGLMGLRDFRAAYPRMLSGGMRQRLALARAYAVGPEILLMDEPFGALDAQTRSAMQRLLMGVLGQEGKTAMLITHSVEEAILLSTRVLVISARPSRVRRVFDIPFPFPRDERVLRDPRFTEIRSEIQDLVMREHAAQEAMHADEATAD